MNTGLSNTGIYSILVNYDPDNFIHHYHILSVCP